MEPESHDVIEWEQLSRTDQIRAEELLQELNDIFNKYSERERQKSCDDSTSKD